MHRKTKTHLLALLVFTLAPVAGRAANNLNDLTLKLQVRPELMGWYNQTARPGDVAVFSDSNLTGLGQITAGKKLVVYASAAAAEQAVPAIAGQIDMIGYDIEHWPQTPPDEQADPVAAIKRMRTLADRYGLKLGVGPDRSYGAQYGAQFAPYVDEYTLQLQNLQGNLTQLNAYALPLIGQLRQANPAVSIEVQLSTDAGSSGLIQLADSLKSQIDGVGVLYTSQTENVLQDFVAQLRSGPPTFVTAPASQTVMAGQNVTFIVVVNSTPAPTYQWQKNGAPIAGANGSTLTLNGVLASDAGSYTVVITNAGGSVVSAPAILSVNTNRLIALSARAGAGTGTQTLIVGFAVAGSSKTLLVRGVGPTLASYGVTGVVADPQLSLYAGSAAIASNDNWGSATNPIAIAATTAQVGLFPLPAGSLDAALLSTLDGGDYTAQVTGANHTAGIALVEIYDANPATASRLIAVSARSQVGTGDNILIAGFTVTGNTPEKLLVRAIGPTLTTYGVDGVLADPKLELYGGSSMIAANDDWSGTPVLSSAFAATGAFALPANSKDAALLITLAAGSYTAQVSGVGNTTGVALVEVYEMP